MHPQPPASRRRRRVFRWDLESDSRGRPNPHIESYLATDPEKRNVQAYIKAGNW